jgi:hypothetical protein
VQRRILDRLRGNLAVLRTSGLRILDIEAGWCAIAFRAEGAEMRLLREHDVLVQPGYFYDFENSGCIVLSLLTAPDIFREGIRRLLLE